MSTTPDVLDRVKCSSDVDCGDYRNDAPQHPYTRRLLSAVPALAPAATGGGVRLAWRLDGAETERVTAG